MKYVENNIKYLIIPDVHGRSFWKKPVKQILENTNNNVVFLGDYLDCYPYEFNKDEDYCEIAISGLNEIIDIKKEFGNQVTLLLGNHDLGYRFDLDICDCRTDYRNFERIRNIYTTNKDLFQLADEAYVNGKHYIFTHAGIHKAYVDFAFPDEKDSINEENIVSYFNNAYYTEEPHVINSLGMYDRYRGSWGYDVGSLVWADVHSWLGEYDGYGYQVFGHTQLEHGCGGIIKENFAMLDSAEPFIINELGELTKKN
jgi:hypothetical protein